MSVKNVNPVVNLNQLKIKHGSLIFIFKGCNKNYEI